jgi:hypothetical protein
MLFRFFEQNFRCKNAAERKVHNEKFHGSYFSPNIAIFKSKRMRWANHVESVRKKGKIFNNFLSENMNGGG